MLFRRLHFELRFFWKPIIAWLFGDQLKAADRSSSLQREVRFWENWLETKGSRWPQDFANRFDKNAPVQGYLVPYIDRVDSECVCILDVGSGPVTKLGKKHVSKQLLITATDLLAEDYGRLLGKLKIAPPIRTIYADAEKLVEQFGQNIYDIVHGQNCIDHTSDPVRAINEMLAVTRPQGFVVLFHAENEGKRERYKQLHQWDFRCEGGEFIICDRRGIKSNMTKKLAGVAEVECTRVPDGSEFAILTGIKKTVGG